jgi:hypothetical protein
MVILATFNNWFKQPKESTAKRTLNDIYLDRKVALNLIK